MVDDEVEQLYQKFGDKICLQPFVNGFINLIEIIKIKPCCHWNDSKNTTKLNTNLQSDLNSDQLICVRKEHFNNNGLNLVGCKKCKSEEEKGIKSLRQKTNRNQIEQIGFDQIDKILENIQKNNFQISNLLSIEYVPSIYCGYACIMCKYDISSGRAALEKKLGKRNEFISNLNLKNKNDLFEIFKKIKHLHLHGGEPLAQKEIREIIDYLIDIDAAKNIDLFIITNLQKYNQELYSKLEKFKKVHITFSIDGIDKFFEYQRINSNWKKVENNLLSIVKNHKNISYFINYVVTSVSFVSIPDFLKWAYLNKFQDVYFTYVFDAPHLTINGLETELVNAVDQKIKLLEKELIDTDDLKDFSKLFEQIYQLIQTHEFDKNVQEQLIKQMKLEDTVRGDDLKLFDVLPHLKNQYDKL